MDQDTAQFYFLEVNTRLQARPTVLLADGLTGSLVPGGPGHRPFLLPGGQHAPAGAPHCVSSRNPYGTSWSLVDQDTAKFHFLEVNTRLQARSCARPPALCAQSWRGAAIAQPWQAWQLAWTHLTVQKCALKSFSNKTLLQDHGGARMQVEHGITEMVSGLDLVEMQLELQVPGLKARQPCTEREHAACRDVLTHHASYW